MATVATKLILDTAGFNRGINSATSSVSKFKNMAGGTAMVAAGFAAIATAATAAAAAIATIGLNKAAEMEGLETAFIPLLGGADAAEKRMKELSKFAAETPFELPEIAKASKVLETLTRGALSTGKGLTLVGDVAAATDVPFSEIATTVGRLYDGLKSGRPVGEVMQRLQELGAVSGDTRARIEELSKSGENEKAWQTAERALGRFSGSMELQSQTWNGLMSTLGDNISMALAEFGEPIMDALKPYLKDVIGFIESMTASAVSLGKSIGEAMSFALTAITSGQVGNLLSAQLKLSGAQFINLLTSGLVGITAFLAQRMVDIPTDFATILGVVTKPEFWQGVGNGLLGAAQKFAAIINRAAAALLEAVSKVPGLSAVGGMAATFRGTADRLDASANQNLGEAGDLLSGPLAEVSARLSASFDNAINAAAIAMEAAGETIDTSELEAARDGIVNTISEQMKANEEAARARFEATKTATPLFDETAAGTTGRTNTGIIAQSLQKVGGGAAFARFSDAANPAAQQLREQQKANGYLSKISDGIYQWINTQSLMPA